MWIVTASGACFGAAVAVADDAPPSMPTAKPNAGFSIETVAPKRADAVGAWLDDTIRTPESKPLTVRRGRRPNQSTKMESGTSTSDSMLGALEMAWPLCAVLALIGLCAFGFRRWMPSKSPLLGGNVVKILARHYVSGKQSVCLMRLGRRLLLVGVSPDRLSTLCEFTDPEEVAELVGAVESGRPNSFTSVFSKFAGSEAVGGDESERGRRKVVEEDLLVSSNLLLRTGDRVRELVERVNTLSSGMMAPAEPVRRPAEAA